MHRFFSPKVLVAATVAAAALGAATAAQARSDIAVSVGFGPVWSEPAPVYVQPRPVYVQPRPVFVEPARVVVRPPVFLPPAPVYENPRWRYDAWERASFRGDWRHRDWRDRFDRDHDRDHGRDHDRDHDRDGHKWHQDRR